MRRGATLVWGLLAILESCGSRTDPWAVPGLTGSSTSGGSGIGGPGTGGGSGSATTGSGSGATGVGGAGTGTGGTGTGAGGSGTGGSGIGGSEAGGAGPGGAGGSGGSGAGGSGTGGVGTGGAGTGGAGTGGTGTGGAAGGGTAGTGGSGGSRDGGIACFRPMQAAVTMQDLYLLLDRSAPMGAVDPPDVTPTTRWARMTKAVETFAKETPRGDFRLGLGFFPFGRPETSPSCATITYTLPYLGFHWHSQEPSLLTNALAERGPGNETWTRPALEGALSYATHWMTNPPMIEGGPSLVPPAVVLITGALPAGCGGTIDNLVATAGASFRSHRVRTHVVTIGPDARGFDAVAAAGGTHLAYSSTSLDLDEIFVRIKRARVICDIPFGDPPMYERPEVARLEVRVGLSIGDPLMTIPKQADAESCGSVGGWFLETPTNPSAIMLCPSTCRAVLDAPAGQVLAGQAFTDRPCTEAGF